MGPLVGIKVVELTGIGPGPMCAMLLADLGATVLRIDRPEPSDLGLQRELRYDLLLRGRPALALDLKSSDGKALALRLVEYADALIEGFRPGVTERLGLGPEDCLARNPRLIYGRVTGWGQDGPLAHAAGHDINYISLAGALHAFGRRGQPPTPPLNLIGDFAGGALYLAFGIVCGILEAQRSGRGQVVDAAMVDGAASLMTAFHGMVAASLATHERGTNHLDTGSHFYNVYDRADGGQILRRIAAPPRHRSGDVTAANGPHALARVAGAACGAVQDPDARGMVRSARRQRRLLRPRADVRRGAAAPAQRGAANLCRDRRDRPTGAGPAIQPHGSRHADPAPAAESRRRGRSRARWLAQTGRDRSTARGGDPRLNRPPPSGGGGFRLVIVVADVLGPSGALALLAIFRHRQMGEQAVRSGTVPMHCIGRDHHGVAGIDRLRPRSFADADTADAGKAIESLADRVGMPAGAGARSERHDRRPHARRRLADEHLVLKHLASEIFSRAALRRPCTCPYNRHRFLRSGGKFGRRIGPARTELQSPKSRPRIGRQMPRGQGMSDPIKVFWQPH